ncbi:triphosphoribosyl-dephospho-CoA synthase [Promethearchaeum syntrophicum]|uniref:Triphosphoribosyl-dephospho-CoA synthase n=1 Tax=Promethearchaeum syntrophicum TaxID=2594042 RepID=A0A5B9D8J0_9ARCH|nr:triphosphoribosyl-dephospho-CoA synthase [Candidatus Prometheoarchaeum syntrophicum]QEE15424.1 ATP:dephospho-CoA triphosphoribosyl transferase [Candidatus Prometheoarchaeum syntrophicum]
MKDINDLIFQPRSMTNVINIMDEASFLEFSTDKPGNIGPSQKLKGISFESFKNVSNEIKKANLRYFKNKSNKKSIGEFIYNAVKSMMEISPHENLLLGHILLYSPLVFASKRIVDCPLESKIRKWDKFWDETEEIINSASVSDGIWLTRAIKLSKAGGLKNPGGKPLKSLYNLLDPEIEQKIRRRNKTLKDLFSESAEFDLIARQYRDNFNFCRNLIKNWVIPELDNFESKSERIIAIFLKILSLEPDSLIYRKNNLTTALKIQKKAQKIQKHKMKQTRIGNILISKLNNYLNSKNGKLNPGTTADLTAVVIFICKLFDIF